MRTLALLITTLYLCGCAGFVAENETHDIAILDVPPELEPLPDDIAAKVPGSYILLLIYSDDPENPFFDGGDLQGNLTFADGRMISQIFTPDGEVLVELDAPCDLAQSDATPMMIVSTGDTGENIIFQFWVSEYHIGLVHVDENDIPTSTSIWRRVPESTDSEVEHDDLSEK